jgi:ABC-type cobalamin transport system ATPase subunit
MVRTVRHGACSVSELPGNEDAALASNLHAGEAVVEAGDDTAHTLRKRHRLWIAHLGFAVGAKLGLAVLVTERLRMVVP